VTPHLVRYAHHPLPSERRSLQPEPSRRGSWVRRGVARRRV